MEQAMSPKVQGFRLSPLQRRLWLRSGGHRVVSQCSVLVTGELRPAVLREAAAAATAEHEILRTTFQSPHGIKVPYQVVKEQMPHAWRELSLAGIPPREQEDRIQQFLAEERRAETNLENGPVLHLAVAELSPDRHILVVTLPLVYADSRTLRNLVMELLGARGFRSHRPEEILQYADVAEWLNELFQSDSKDENAEVARGFWRRQALEAGELPPLPGEMPAAPRTSSFEFRSVGLDLTAELASLEACARAQAVSLSDVLLGCWQTLLWRLVGGDQVTVNVGFEGRRHPELQDALGLFVRWLPLRGRFDPRQRFSEVLRQVADSSARLAEWQDYADWEEGGRYSRDSSFAAAAFEFEVWPDEPRTGKGTVSLLERHVPLEPFRIKLDCLRRGDRLSADIRWDTAVLTQPSAEMIARHLVALLRTAVTDPQKTIGDLDLLGPEDRHELLITVNAGDAPATTARSVHELFEEQVRRTPEATAAVFEDDEISYGELNRRANRLAHHLRDLGMGPEDRIAICLERSLDLLTALFGVLKAGAAFVPLNPAFPPDRLSAMIEDAGARALVARGAWGGKLPGTRALVVHLDDPALDFLSDLDLQSAVEPENLAYVLFTSGSSGRPKGVAVEHRHLLNYVAGIVLRLDLPAASSYATVSTFAADLGNTAIYPALCTGGQLHLLSEERASDPSALADYCQLHRIDCLKIVPSHLAALMSHERPAELLPKQKLVLGGEVLSWHLVRRIRDVAPELEVLNHYGPTETTVGVLAGPVGDRSELDTASVPLGRPLPGSRIYVLDARLQPVPMGVPGELHVGGGNVSRGYLGRPDTTAEKFIPDPFSGESGTRLYKTGDLVRFRQGGVLEFLGRRDRQVKIQGFRIEPGEIEALLLEYPAVREVVVLARTEVSGTQHLVAYLVLRRGQDSSVAELREWVARRVPAHMVPAAFVFLEALPLTPNGKLDSNALPAPERAPAALGRPFVPPRTPAERILADIWSHILRVEKVGGDDNFFELGGDSILSIQVIAQASRAGLVLHPRQVFQHQTLAELAAVAGSAPAILAEQDAVIGEVPLTPIQRWFLEQGFADPHHWNQAVLLESAEDLALPSLEAALGWLLIHHDALRACFEETGGNWRQVCRAPDSPVPLTVVDLPPLPDAAFKETVTAAAGQAQTAFDLAGGRLFRAVVFRCRSRVLLLLAAHHLVVDGVSWRILLEDLTTAYRALAAGLPPGLPAKTSSFRQWAARLTEHAHEEGRQAESAFWLERLSRRPAALPSVSPGGPNSAGSAHSVEVVLERDGTGELLRQALAAFGVQIHELLLASVALAVARWSGQSSCLIELEGHGREPLFSDLDVSRTVGWFTSHFPMLLDVGTTADLQGSLRRIKEQVRAVPDRGIGYGLVRYLSGRRDVAERLAGLPHPEIVFNYLGRFEDTGDGQPALLTPARLSSGPTVSSRSLRPFALEVTSAVLGGQLSMSWTYSASCHRRETVEHLAGVALETLRSLIQKARSGEAEALTPSDFPLAKLSQDALDRVLRQVS
jgi:amino acid adenylation domain-containing protein/non-ribosomal peptide synthase protein (TIGR01720 family)